ncbi:MAG TPA: alpha/beta hydrolase [Blastocatellia bacterium]|nr:alpha/beta hydrolase [Blastocatellia bacterium]
MIPTEQSSPPQHEPQRSTLKFFPGFSEVRQQTTGATINGVIGGSGPPVLLLHGWPQTHIEWHKITPMLAQRFTVIATDLRGYGDSSKPEEGINHEGYSKRAMARDQLELMRQLGFNHFAVVGHDRGGRVGHRMSLDYPEAVTKLAVLDIVPTYKLYTTVTREFASVYFHWFFFIQPSPLPETLIASNAEFILRAWAFRGLIPSAISDEAFEDYLRCFSDPRTLHAMCEDYRAGATIDLEHDKADLEKKVQCPLLALWGSNGAMEPLFDVVATWKERATLVKGKALAGGHFLPEQLPDEVHTELEAFLSS